MIDIDKMRTLAKRVLDTMDQADNEAFERARYQFRAATHPETILALLNELEAAAADKKDSTRRWSREDVQNKAIEHGLKYWRAPDAHGVEGTKQQTIDLLQDLLGVEVEIQDASQDQPWEIAGIDVPDDQREVMVFLNGDCDLCDWDGRKGGGWGIRLGFYDHGKRYWRVHGCREDFVTHWRDLPDGPATAVKNIAAIAQQQENKNG